MMTLAMSAQTPEIYQSVAFTEGPTVDSEGNIYFTELVNQRIYKVSPAGVMVVFREQSNGANGLVIDAEGRLIAAESGISVRTGVEIKGIPRVTRTDLRSGDVVVLADNYRGAPFVSPNDVTHDGKGRIYFSDPGGSAVYRIDAPGQVVRIIAAPDLRQPGGLQISPDGKTLYVGEYSAPAGGPRLVRAFDLSPDGTATNTRVFYDFKSGRGPDGMCIDTEGTLYVVAGLNATQTGPRASSSATTDTKAGIYVISPAGNLLRFIALLEDNVTNCAFGGPDMKTMYATAGKTLYRIPMTVAGLPR